MKQLVVFTLSVFLASCANEKPAEAATVKGLSDTIKKNVSVTAEENDEQNVSTVAITENLDYLNDQRFPFDPDDSIVGIGIVSIENYDPYINKLTIYDTLGKARVEIKVEGERIVTRYEGRKFKSGDELNLFRPRQYSQNPDYFSLSLDCIKSDDDFYTVLINRRTGELGKIRKNDKHFKFETIEQYVEGWTSLGFDFDRSVNPVRKAPRDNSPVIRNDQQSKYKIWNADVVSLEGDWLEIHIGEDDNGENGWIRWRKGNQILIRMYFAC